MSLMKTLARVAVGVAVAKGAQAVMRGAGQKRAAQGGGPNLAGLLGGLTGGRGAPAQGAAGLQNMLGGLLGGAQGGAAQGGLGGLLNQLGGVGAGGGADGLQKVLGGLAGSAGAAGLLGGLTNALDQRPAASSASFGDVLNSAFAETPQEAIEPSADQEAAAALMLRAMIQAAKCDGKLDDAEREKLIGQLGDTVSGEEAAFVQTQIEAPVDIDALAQATPQGMETQIYMMSVLGIDLDSRAEAEYLHKLATRLGLEAREVNDVHAKLGVPSLYT